MVNGSKMKALFTKATRIWILIVLLAESAESSTYLETAPLRGALGLPSIRGEWELERHWATVFSCDYWKKSGFRKGYQDQQLRLGGHVAYYPQHRDFPGLFGTFGGLLSQVRFGEQRERPYITEVNYSSRDRYDSWATESYRLDASGQLGYRIDLQEIFTTSFLLQLNRTTFETSRVVDEDIKTFGYQPQTKKSEGFDQYLVFYLGVILK